AGKCRRRTATPSRGRTASAYRVWSRRALLAAQQRGRVWEPVEGSHFDRAAGQTASVARASGWFACDHANNGRPRAVGRDGEASLRAGERSRRSVNGWLLLLGGLLRLRRGLLFRRRLLLLARGRGIVAARRRLSLLGALLFGGCLLVPPLLLRGRLVLLLLARGIGALLLLVLRLLDRVVVFLLRFLVAL